MSECLTATEHIVCEPKLDSIQTGWLYCIIPFIVQSWNYKIIVIENRLVLPALRATGESCCYTEAVLGVFCAAMEEFIN